MKRLVVLFLCVFTVLALPACSDKPPTPSATVPAHTEQTQGEPSPSPAPSPTPVKTTAIETEAPITATITVEDGDTLERDIIPQLKEAFALSEEQVKQALEKAESDLIGKAKGFRRMEGMIPPGSYNIKDEGLDWWVNEWIRCSKQRYEALLSQAAEENGLSAAERLTLASVIEGDTNLADAYEDVTAAVFLNRIKRNDTFGSCPTVEYALGYQRPYLTKDDVAVESEYNTYRHKGLPPGPICCMDDESLMAAMQIYADARLYFFFYDYVKNEILAFESYEDFRAAGADSKALFEATFSISRFEKMDDKREYFGS